MATTPASIATLVNQWYEDNADASPADLFDALHSLAGQVYEQGYDDGRNWARTVANGRARVTTGAAKNSAPKNVDTEPAPF